MLEKLIKTAEIIVTGNEILTGRTRDSNSAFLASELYNLGIELQQISTVGDEPAALKEIGKQAFERSDLVLCTGGLGPTDDDLSMAVMAAAAGVELEENTECLRHIEDYFAKSQRVCPTNNYKQCLMPKGAEVLSNPNGTACGCFLKFAWQDQPRYLLLLPGPPGELEPMWQKEASPRLAKLVDVCEDSWSLAVFGLGESYVEMLIRDLIRENNGIRIATYANEGVIQIVLRAQHPQDGSYLAEVVHEIKSRLGHFCFAENHCSLEEVLYHILLEQKKTISLAESCTAGGVAASLGRVPGVSEVFPGGIVSYQEKIKTKVLQVQPETIAEHTAVSLPVVEEMVAGLDAVIPADLCLALSGLAGPTGASPGIPVGTVCFALKYQGEIKSVKLHFSGERQQVRRRAAQTALDLARRALLAYPLVEKAPPL